MKKFVALGLLSSALVVGGISLNINKQNVKEERDARIIVSFKNYSQNMTDAQVLSYQNRNLNLISEQVTSNFKVENRYTTLLNAVLLEVPAGRVNDIRNLSFVKAVDYDTLHHVEEKDGITIYRQNATRSNGSDENVSATTMNVPANTKAGEGTLVGILDTGFLVNHTHEGKAYTHETFTELPTGVATKLSKATVDGLTGLNAKAETVDSLYYNNKVPFYYDYGGDVDTYDDYGKKFTPDNDVFSDLSDHGLHVASMAAGNAPSYKGIAYNAQLALFKVFTEYHPNNDEKKKYNASQGCFDSAVIGALEDAAKLGCDVLNMSFGSDLNDFGESTIVFNLLQTLRDQGIWSNYAAGNSGKGFFTGTAYEGWTADMVDTGIVSGSANLESVMTVGASQAKAEYYEDVVQINGQNISYMDEVVSTSSTTYDPERPLWGLTNDGKNVEFPYVRLAKIGEAKEYKNVDVKGKIAIVDRGTITFEEKVVNAQKAGAIALAVVNTSNDAVRMSFGNTTPSIPVILLSYEDREKVGTGSGTLTVLKNVYADNPTAKEMATFTSDGATFDYRIKPEISAPGRNVKGAVSEDSKGKLDPTVTDGYAYWSGTSMATPNYTGVIALMLSENLDKPNYYKTVNARTMSTATQYVDKNKVAASVRIQGAGVPNVTNALETQVYLEEYAGSGKAKIQLQNNDDIKNGTLKLAFSATNETSAAIAYKAHVDIYMPDVYKYEKGEYEIPEVKNITIQGIRNKLLKTVDVDITIPAGTNTIELDPITLTDAEKKAIEDYFEYACAIEGYIRLESDSATNLSIPFLGYYGDTTKAEVVEPFNFEKDPNKVYPSTLVNDLASLVDLKNADFSSDIVTGYFNKDVWADHSDDDNYKSPLSDWFSNKGGIDDIADSNGYKCSRIGNRKQADGSYTLYTSNDVCKRSNTLIIQQFVMRSIKDNTLNIIRKSDGEVILRDHMFDSFWGDGGEDGEEPNYTLGKSFILSDYYDTYIGHRAYSIIPLWDNEEKSETYLQDYPEGEYTLEFTYVAMDNVVHKKVYDLVINNAEPKLNSISENGNYIRVRFDNAAGGLNANVIGNSTVLVDADVDEDGFYVDIPKDQLNSKTGKLFYSASGLSKNKCSSILKVTADDMISVTSSEFITNSDFKIAKTTDGNTINYTLTFTKNSSTVKLKNPVRVTMSNIPGYGSDQLTITDFDAEGNGSTVTFDANGYGFAFESAIGKFSITVNGDKSHSIVGIGANMTQDTFVMGDALDQSTIKVFSIYDNGVTEAYTGNFTVSGFDSSSVGKKTLTITANGLSTSLGYEVVNPPAIVSIEANAGKTTYLIGEEFDFESLNVVAVKEDESREVLDVKDVTVTGFDSSVAGTITVTITYQTFTTTLELKIVEPEPPEPEPKKGCGGEVVATSVILSAISLAGVALLLLKKRKED